MLSQPGKSTTIDEETLGGLREELDLVLAEYEPTNIWNYNETEPAAPDLADKEQEVSALLTKLHLQVVATNTSAFDDYLESVEDNKPKCTLEESDSKSECFKSNHSSNVAINCDDAKAKKEDADSGQLNKHQPLYEPKGASEGVNWMIEYIDEYEIDQDSNNIISCLHRIK